VSQGGTGLSVGCDHQSGANYPLDATLVTCTATDSFGSSEWRFFVIVSDFTPPVLTLPGNIVSADPVVTFTATAVDALDGQVPVSCSPASGSTFPFGTTIVQCVATDTRENPATGVFSVKITGGPPVLSLPDDFYVAATSASGAIVTYIATVEDGTISCDRQSGTQFPLGSTTVTCTATGVGTTSGSFVVTVVDLTPPELNLPDVTAGATSASGATVNYVATGTDTVDGTVLAVCTPPSGTFFPIGETTVACSATDAHGNASYATFTVTVRPDSPPGITSISATPNILWPPDHKMYPVQVTVIATDDNDPNPTSQIISVSSNQPINGTGDGDTSPDWLITGALTLQLRAERSGNVDRIYTITVQTSDSGGHSVQATVKVKVTQQNAKNHAVQITP
jgi:hypothetical protein